MIAPFQAGVSMYLVHVILVRFSLLCERLPATTQSKSSCSVTVCTTTSSSMITSSNWSSVVDWLSTVSQFSPFSLGVVFSTSPHDGAWLFAISSSWVAAWTSAQVGPTFVVGVELLEGPTVSVLSHSSPESTIELSVSLSAPASMHFTISVEGSLAGNSLRGEGTILLRSLATRNSGIVRVDDIPRTGTHCAISHWGS